MCNSICVCTLRAAATYVYLIYLCICIHTCICNKYLNQQKERATKITDLNNNRVYINKITN